MVLYEPGENLTNADLETEIGRPLTYAERIGRWFNGVFGNRSAVSRAADASRRVSPLTPLADRFVDGPLSTDDPLDFAGEAYRVSNPAGSIVLAGVAPAGGRSGGGGGFLGGVARVFERVGTVAGLALIASVIVGGVWLAGKVGLLK